jgi:hypothetical protein
VSHGQGGQKKGTT